MQSLPSDGAAFTYTKGAGKDGEEGQWEMLEAKSNRHVRQSISACIFARSMSEV